MTTEPKKDDGGPRDTALSVEERRFKHVKTGGYYTILAEGVIEADLTPCVIYRSEKPPHSVWVRPLAEFYDGRFVAAPPQAQEGKPAWVDDEEHAPPSPGEDDKDVEGLCKRLRERNVYRGYTVGQFAPDPLCIEADAMLVRLLNERRVLGKAIQDEVEARCKAEHSELEYRQLSEDFRIERNEAADALSDQSNLISKMRDEVSILRDENAELKRCASQGDELAKGLLREAKELKDALSDQSLLFQNAASERNELRKYADKLEAESSRLKQEIERLRAVLEQIIRYSTDNPHVDPVVLNTARAALHQDQGREG